MVCFRCDADNDDDDDFVNAITSIDVAISALGHLHSNSCSFFLALFRFRPISLACIHEMQSSASNGND